jgi:hypothetical protein
MCLANNFPRQSDNGLLHSFSPSAISDVPGNPFKEDVQSTTKGWLMPHWVLRHPKMTAQEKQIMGVIVCLHENQGCHCSNLYLANQIGSNVNAVRQCLVRLRKKKLLEPNEMIFGQKFEGDRLVPIYPSGLNSSGALLIEPPSATIRDTDKKYISIDKRESPEPSFEYSEASKATIAGLLEGRGFAPERSRKAVDQLVAEKTALGILGEIRDPLEYLTNRLLKEDRDRVRQEKKSPYSAAPARYESQFSVSH